MYVLLLPDFFFSPFYPHVIFPNVLTFVICDGNFFITVFLHEFDCVSANNKCYIFLLLLILQNYVLTKNGNEDIKVPFGFDLHVDIGTHV